MPEDYSRPPKHLRVTARDNLAKLPRCLWTAPADFRPEYRDEETGDYFDWGVPPVRVLLCVLREAG